MHLHSPSPSPSPDTTLPLHDYDILTCICTLPPPPPPPRTPGTTLPHHYHDLELPVSVLDDILSHEERRHAFTIYLVDPGLTGLQTYVYAYDPLGQQANAQKPPNEDVEPR